MTARDILMSAGGTKDKLYVNDVFATYLYGGNGAVQAINNGIDLSGKGGMVWARARNIADNNSIYDTKRGGTKRLVTNSTNAEDTQSSSPFSSFNGNGFSLLTSTSNALGYDCASWAFRCAPKFFDVVTYTGDGSNVRGIPHSLGSSPGMVIIKATNSVGNWVVLHSSDGTWGAASPYLWRSGFLNSSDSMVGNSELLFWMNANTFQVANGSGLSCNVSGVSYVAYLFGSDTNADGLIKCGSFTTDPSGKATVNLGWEPQFVLIKCASYAGDWVILDTTRGMSADGLVARLLPNSSTPESEVSNVLGPTATGLNAFGLAAATSYIYMAIRRPNKPPKSGAEVFASASVTTQTITTWNTGFPVDLVFGGTRTSFGASWFDRLRGYKKIDSSNTNKETDRALYPTIFGSNTGISSKEFSAGYSAIFWNFRRAPGFMDVVCYMGDGAPKRSVAHNLEASPNLVIIKSRSSNAAWAVNLSTGTYGASFANLASTGAASPFNETPYNPHNPSGFEAGEGMWAFNVNVIGTAYVAYLFATLPGISKVGTYTGNGSSQTINCGFSNGARFVLIKRIDAQSSWYVWDSARGITAANDPYLKLNSTAGEETAEDAIDPAAVGFIINQDDGSNMNVVGSQYLYLAVA